MLLAVRRPRSGLHGALALGALLVALAGCGESNGRARPVPRSVTWTAPPDEIVSTPPTRDVMTPPRPSAAERRAAPRPSVTNRGSVDAAAAADPTNRQKPPAADPELERQARSLLLAVIGDEPSRAEGFFFPRQPFTPLKVAQDPDRYWRRLHAAYARDIQWLHRRWSDWSSATFESIRLTGQVTWVKPGVEHNKIGYYRTYQARLRYRMGEQRLSLFVHTLISWQGRWYVTHLLPQRRRKKKA